MKISSLLLSACVLAAAGSNQGVLAASAITSNINDVASTSWDFIVLGAGLSGLTVANRLTEKNATVLVVEAGADIRNYYSVSSVSTYGLAFITDLNWGFKITGAFGNGRTMNAGRGLGGSTSINGAAWTRGAKEQYDAIEKLGNPGWNWQSLLGYMKKSENFHAPNNAQRALGAGYDATVHGSSGPLDISYTPAGPSTSRRSVQRRMYTDYYGDKFFSAAAKAIGLRRITDITNGDIHGTGSTTPNTILPNSNSQTRVSSATAYFSPIEFNRPNLKVLTGWRGVKAIYDTADPLKVVGAVVQQSSSGSPRNLTAKKAVIVAMGAINTPGFLERSGVGDPAVINPLGIATKVNLPAVGRNLQDQTINSISAQPIAKFNGTGPSAHIAFPSIDNLFSNASAVRTDLESKYDQYASKVVSEGGAISTDAVKAQWKLLTSNIWDNKVGVSELFLDHGFPKSGLGQDIWHLLVYSRGKVHIKTTSAFDNPTVNPAYFQIPIDMDITVASLRAGRKIYQTSPLKETLSSELVPGTSLIPSGTNFGLYRRWRDWVIQGFAPVAHQLGSAQMAPRAIGGVVDPSGSVYGISKGSLRVVDASTLPFQLSAHLSATLYGMTEKFADAIKKDFAL